MSDLTSVVAVSNAAVAKKKTPPRAWGMLAVILLLSIAIPIVWFSLPPLATIIQGVGPFEAAGPTFDVLRDNPEFKATNFGNLMSAVSLFSFIAAIFASPIAKKFGVKTVVLLAGICATIGACLMALSGESYAVLLAGRCFVGLGGGFICVSGPTTISLWFSDKNRGFAVALWSIWVPAGMLISTNLIVNPMLAGMSDVRTDFYACFWVMAIIIAICAILCAVFYRNPQGDEVTEVSTEPMSFKKILPFVKQHQFIALIIAWLAFEFINYTFTTYNVEFFQQGFGMDRNAASTWGSIASAFGICAPLFGFISDRINRNRKYLLIILGMLFLLLACFFGFRPGAVADGTLPAIFWAYLIFQALGNAILVASIRPYVPILVGRGGVTAVTFALSLLTLLQYTGGMFAGPLSGGVHDIVMGQELANGMNQAAAYMAGWAGTRNFVLIPLGIVALVATFFIKPGKKQAIGEVDFASEKPENLPSEKISASGQAATAEDAIKNEPATVPTSKPESATS